MTFARPAFLAALAFASGCTSASFETQPSGPGVDTGVPGDDTSAGGDGDATIDPCAPVDGVAKFCVNVAKVDAHPAYDNTSGADVLGLDGTGRLKVYLFKEDPSDPTRPTPIKPILSIAYPSGGGSVRIDKDLPVAIADSAPEGDYWFTVVFEDNGAVTRPDTYAATFGDFIVVPPVVDNHLVFPKVTLVKGQTKAIPVSIKPLREVAATVQVSAALSTLAKSTKPEIHGDGPLAFLFFKGDLGATPTYYDLAYYHCIDLKPKTTAETVPVALGSILAPGSYKVIGVLFDYDYSTTDALGNPFPGKGSMVSPYADGALGRVVTVDILPDKWLATTDVTMVDVPRPPGDTTLDKQICPGAK
jgi:hypothetical protein